MAISWLPTAKPDYSELLSQNTTNGKTQTTQNTMNGET